MCTRPIIAYRSRQGPNKKTGKWPLVFSVASGYIDLPVELPCGQCIACRLEKSRQWAVRCVNEASMYEDNCFVTLTYDNEHIPQDLSLDKIVIQKFMKKLRKKFGEGIRYYLCGEYGEYLKRPHYHLCLFNFRFTDAKLYAVRGGSRLYRSAVLERLWNFGFSTIGDVSWESAAYVARYITKKITGDAAEDHYQGKKPEFCLMSRRPGIGKPWYERWKMDMKNTDSVVVRKGLVINPPRYYNSMWEVENPIQYKEAKKNRSYGRVRVDADEKHRLDGVNEVVFKKHQKRRYENEESNNMCG